MIENYEGVLFQISTADLGTELQLQVSVLSKLKQGCILDLVE